MMTMRILKLKNLQILSQKFHFMGISYLKSNHRNAQNASLRYIATELCKQSETSGYIGRVKCSH